MGVYEYARPRIDEAEADKALVLTYCETITDRLVLRLGVTELPEAFVRIAADAVVKMHRRMYYEGIKSEGIQGNAHLTTEFVDDILAEYSAEIEEYKATAGGMVTFI